MTVRNLSHLCMYCMLLVALKSRVCWMCKYDMTCNLAASGSIYSNSFPLEKSSPGWGIRPENCCCDYPPATHTLVYRYFPTNTHWHTQTVTSARPIRGGFHLVFRGKLDMVTVSLPSLLLPFSHAVVSSTCSFFFSFAQMFLYILSLHFQLSFLFFLYPDLLTGHL